MDPQALRTELKRLIIDSLDLRGRTEADIDDDAPLFGDGLKLDSLDALQLAVALEERYGLEIPEGEESRRIFASVSALATYVASKLPPVASGQVTD
ncbi:MAG TPA: phosphopantetheine-binding protein [Polyangiaceae bacterium]|nr:phosphopantetheine-binding protein [Polyangiaceae bacterium]